jgi:kynurenine formamidase
MTNMSKGYDLSIPIGNVKCFQAPDLVVEPFKAGSFVGAVREGAPVNFFNVAANPHGNGTHTECVGHISKEIHSVNKAISRFHFVANLISVTPSISQNGDFTITLEELKKQDHNITNEVVIIRTLPNEIEKLTKNYSNTNPPYFTDEAMSYICDKGVEHLLVDLPSVDKEYDEGNLSCHNIFWNTNGAIRHHATITELIYVKNEIPDGLYLLNLQLAALDLDASFSRAVIFPLQKTDHGK